MTVQISAACRCRPSDSANDGGRFDRARWASQPNAASDHPAPGDRRRGGRKACCRKMTERLTDDLGSEEETA